MHNQHNLQILYWVSRCFCFCSASGFRISEFFRMSHDQWPRLFWSAIERKKGVTVGAIEMDGNQYPKEIHHKDLWVFSQASNAMHSGCHFQRRMLLCCWWVFSFFSAKPVWYFSQLCELKCKSEASGNTFISEMLLRSTKSFHFSKSKYKGKLWN